MKTKYQKHFRGGVIAGLFLLMALGCSDGELAPTGPNPGGNPIPPPDIKSFAGDPMSVQAGGSATLAWEVAGADKVEITASGDKTNFHYSTTTDFKSQTSVSGLQETTTFILVATKNPPAEGEASGGEEAAAGMRINKQAAPGGSEEGAVEVDPPLGPQPATSQKTVTITVEGGAGALSIEEFYAEAEQTSGESTLLHWSVLPSDAQVSITSSAGDQPVAVDCTGEELEDQNSLASAEELEQEGEVVATYPASGCASVQPSETATYTLTATLGDQQPVSDEVTIQVSKAPSVDSFTANGSTALRVSNYPSQVEIAWRVVPSTASVAITSEPAIEGLEGPDALPAEGSVTVTVSQDTTFSLTASVEGEEPATAQVRVTSDLASINCDQFILSAPTSPVFAGETVRVSWQLPAGVGAVQSVKVGNNEAVSASQGYADVPVSKKGYIVQFLTSGGQAVCSKPVVFSTASMEQISSDKAVRVVKDPADADGVYVGLDLNGFNGGKIRVVHYQPAEELIEIDYFKTLQGFDAITKSLNATVVENLIKTFPVNAVAKSSERLFAATTGAILYQTQDEEGKPVWKTLTPLLRTDNNNDYSGSHPTCFGKTQTGKKSRVRGEIVTMGQVCDMIATDDGKLYVATDRGLYYLDNVEAYITDYHGQVWKGRESGNPLYGKVVNDVEIDGSTVYAAGLMGVYKSDDSGASWQALKEGVAAYSVAVVRAGIPIQTIDSAGQIYTGPAPAPVLVVGIDGGVLVKMYDREWKNIALSGTVYSVTADPYAMGVVYAGTSTGFYVSRDAGQTFNQVTLEGDAQPAVRSIAVLYSSDPTEGEAKCYVYLATEQGVMRAYMPETRIEERVPYDNLPQTGSQSNPQGGPVVGGDPDGGESTAEPQASGWFRALQN